MQDSEQHPALIDLLHNASKALDLRNELRNSARRMTVEDLQQTVDTLQIAVDQGNVVVLDASLSPEKQQSARRALDHLHSVISDAKAHLDRKRRWDHDVGGNSRIIRINAAKAAELHRHLRDKRRDMRAREVQDLQNQLAALEAEALAAWGVARAHQLPVGLEHRLYSAVETITNALKDAEGTFHHKKPWEDAVAANVAAVEAELTRLVFMVGSSNETNQSADSSFIVPEQNNTEADAASEPGPESPTMLAGASVVEVERQIRRAEEMLRTRKPIDRQTLSALRLQLDGLIGAFRQRFLPPQEDPKALEAKRASLEERRQAREELESSLAQCEAALGLPWPPVMRLLEPDAPSLETVSPDSPLHPKLPSADVIEALELESSGLSNLADELPPDMDDNMHELVATASVQQEAVSSGKALPGTKDAAASADSLVSAISEQTQEGSDVASDDRPDASCLDLDTAAAVSDSNRGEDSARTDATTKPSAKQHAAPAAGKRSSVYPAPADRKPVSIGALKTVSDLLKRVREVLESGNISGVDRKRFWVRFRYSNEYLKVSRNQTRSAELIRIDEQVRELSEAIPDRNPIDSRKLIQQVQREVLDSSLGRGERDRLLGALRGAWKAVEVHQEELIQKRRQREQEGLQKLEGHLHRWEDRHEAIQHKISRLGEELVSLKERQRTSTSIGYRVIAEQRINETKAQIEELRQLMGDLEKRIADVKPRVEHAVKLRGPEQNSDEVVEGGSGEGRT